MLDLNQRELELVLESLAIAAVEADSAEAGCDGGHFVDLEDSEVYGDLICKIQLQLAQSELLEDRQKDRQNDSTQNPNPQS